MTPLSVLIVDDDFRVAELHAARVIETPGFTAAATARTAREALDAAYGIDLALVDLYLPDGPGTELIRRLSCDAVVLSAAAEGETVRRAMSAGALGYLIKPFPADRLTRLLRGYARYRRLTEAEALDQEALDEALSALRGTSRQSSGRPAAAGAATRDLVLAALAESGQPLSSGEVASGTGVSRSTAQRYLAELTEQGHIGMRLRYGATGRPEQEYFPH
ncbi:MAG: response regulator [Saccharopolyspora sp.]|uniref:response regulator n=1 Tax=Saccharopolyspora sp. TaxID=33915 RepID=UPI0025CD62C3|nr:response regulator [Saccharopolyspora sp.]MBQ6643364.1 response regulator [Saccharopolyspora sp.]